MLDRAALQAQIDRAAPGAAVTLPSGVLYGTLVIRVPLTLRGAGAEATTIDAQGRHVVVAVDAREGTVRLEDLTLRGGRGEVGGGLSCANGARVELWRCAIRDSEAARGGAAAIEDGALEARSCVFAGNRARLGGALYVGESARAAVTASRFEDNEAARGGALACADDARVAVEDCRIAGNRAREHGPAIYLRGAGRRAPRLTLARVAFDGGGAALHNDARFPGVIRLDDTALGASVEG